MVQNRYFSRLPIYVILLYLLSPSFSFSQIENPPQLFSNEACLDLNFKLEEKIKWNKWSFWDSSLILNKERCKISIHLKKWPWRWDLGQLFISFDVCREPIHLKKGQNQPEIIQRNETSFIKEYFFLEDLFLNKMIVKAEGEKENLISEHGKLYCAFLLSYNYLGKGKVFIPFLANISHEGMLIQRAQELEKNSIHIQKMDDTKKELDQLKTEREMLILKEKNLEKRLIELETKKEAIAP